MVATPPTPTANQPKINLPTPGTHVQMNAGKEVMFNFNTSEATFERVENDLQIQADGGGTVTLTNFFVAEGAEALPVFTMEDGQQVASADFLKLLDVDISTAVGPSPASPTSGLGAYDDNTGSLLGGTDRLGSLGTDQWGRTTGQQETDAGLLTPVAAAAGPAPSPGPAPGPGPGPGPVPPVNPNIYDARAVIYTLDTPDSTLKEVTFAGLNIDSPDKIVWKDSAFKDLFTIKVENGQLTLTLNEKGLAYVTDHDTTDIFSYITLTDTSGKSYRVQLVLNQNDDVNSHDLDTKKAADNGGHDLAPGGLAHGEWHQGQDFTDGTMHSSDLSDSILYTGAVKGSTIEAGSGNDTITVKGILSGGSTITAGDATDSTIDQDTVFIGGMSAQGGKANTVSAEGGTVTVEQVLAQGSAFAMKAAGGSNSINTISADVLLNAKGETAAGMETKNSGSNSVESVNGNISVDAQAQQTLAFGVRNEGTTLLDTKGKITVKAESHGDNDRIYGSGVTAALSNISGDMKLHANEIDLFAKTKSNSDATGIGVSDGSVNVLATKDINIEVIKDYAGTAKDGARGIQTANGTGKIDVTSEKGNVTIKVDDNATLKSLGGHQRSIGAIGVNASGKTTVDIEATEGNVSLLVNQETGKKGSEAWGAYTLSGAKTNITGNEVEIKVNSDQRSTGMETQADGSVTEIRANKILIDVDSSGNARGMIADVAGLDNAGGKNILTALSQDGKGTVTLDIDGASATAMSAVAKGQNLIEADIVRIDAKGSTFAAKGLETLGNASNTITGNDVKITLEGSTVIGLGASGANDTISPPKNLIQGGTSENTAFELNMTAKSGNAYGMQAESGGENTIEDFSSVRIAGTATKNGSLTGSAIGMNANGGQNTISKGGAVTIDMKSYDGAATGMNAADGQNTIQNVASVNIKATADMFNNAKDFSTGLSAKNSGTNTIQNVAGKVSVEAGNNAMDASGAGSSNTIANAGSVTIAGGYMGLYTNAGTNTIQNIHANKGVAGADGKVTITSDKAYAVDATAGGKNVITNVDSVSITAKLAYDSSGKSINDGENFALHAISGGTNIISNVKETVEINAIAKGIYATGAGSANEIDVLANGATVTITAGTAVQALNGGANTIKADTVNLNGKIGVYATNDSTSPTSGSTNTITAANDVNINIAGTQLGGVMGMWAYTNAGDANASTNTITTKNATIAVNVDENGNPTFGGNSAGMQATGKATDGNAATNTITATGAVDIKVGSTTGTASGMYASSGGINTVTANGDMKVSAIAGGAAYGLNADANSQNKISANGTLGISATSASTSTGEARGINASNGAPAAGTYNNNVYSQGDLSIKATSDKGPAAAVVAQYNGKNFIESASKIEIYAHGPANINGVHAGGGSIAAPSSNELRAGATGISITASANGATGVTKTYTHGVAVDARTNSGNNSNTIKSVGDVTITSKNSNINAGDSTAYGMIISGASGKNNTNTVTSSEGSITVGATSGTYAYGLQTDNSGQNTLTAAENITVTSSANTAWGLFAASSGTNTLNAAGGVTLTTNANTGTAIGMHAATRLC